MLQNLINFIDACAADYNAGVRALRVDRRSTLRYKNYSGKHVRDYLASLDDQAGVAAHSAINAIDSMLDSLEESGTLTDAELDNCWDIWLEKTAGEKGRG